MACETEIHCVTFIGSVVNLLLVCLKSICVGVGTPAATGMVLNSLIYSRLLKVGCSFFRTLLLLFN